MEHGESKSRFELVPLPGGGWAVHDRAWGETMHPVAGPEIEPAALYVEELQLPQLWTRVESGRQALAVVWDVGLGAGANALAVLCSAAARRVRLRLWSFDLSLDALAFARAQAGRLRYLAGWEPVVDEFLVTGSFIGRVGTAEVEWRFIPGDFARWLAIHEPPADAPDAVAFDPYSPSRHPDLWTAEVFQRLHSRLDPSRACVLTTYSRSNRIRTALLMGGFFVGRGRPVGVKEETTVASNRLELLSRPLDHTWLNRLRRTPPAGPDRHCGDGDRMAALSTWERLRQHPQFAGERMSPARDQGAGSSGSGRSASF